MGEIKPVRIGILASGRGSNFKAIAEHCRQGRCAGEIAVLVSDKEGAGALDIARSLGIPAYVVLRKDHPSREAFEQAIVQTLRAHDVELVCLAGYMRLVHDPLLQAYPQRILNIHPALLPAFPGLDAQKQALEYGVKISGCTVHFVDAGMDTGPIILQEAVPVLEDDDEHSLAARILEREHQLYARAIDLFARGRLVIEGRRVRILP
ncbi:MAG: phosphoribosylglycinamide formyltransferase [Candidatus Sumerlaeia bacterium]